MTARTTPWLSTNAISEPNESLAPKAFRNGQIDRNRPRRAVVKTHPIEHRIVVLFSKETIEREEGSVEQ